MFFVTVKVIKRWKSRTPDSILGKPVQTTHYVSELSKKKDSFRNYLLFIISTAHKTVTLYKE